MKWLLSLVLLTSLFILAGFFMDPKLMRGYWFFTMGMAVISFNFYFIIYFNRNLEKKKILGPYIAAIGVKFILTVLLVVIYALVFGMKQKIDFLFFFIAFFLYSAVLYTGAYNSKL